MQDVQQSKEKTLANNRTLAEQNLILQPNLEHKKEQLTKTYRFLQENFESYQLRKSTLGTSAPNFWVSVKKTACVICLGGFLTPGWLINSFLFCYDRLSTGYLGNVG